ncbi:MAG: rocF [Gammaproteobacteria bacterium]|jgi:arginase|nr:rocF [Gammaproteobacteria bacterium]
MEKGLLMRNKKAIYLLGYASSVGGPGPGCSDGPLFLRNSPYFAALAELGIALNWQLMTQPIESDISNTVSVTRQCTLIAEQVAQLVEDEKFFMVMGGDHSSAIGTWSGAHKAMQSEGSLGLIWIDAHMDSHTPQTTLTGNIHGMPLACLLGFGEKKLVELETPIKKFKPEHICLIGIRSFESAEKELLERLKVRIIDMDEVRQRGLVDVFNEAVKIATTGTVGYGLSIDVDSVDPLDAPGTDVVAPGGLSGDELCRAVEIFAEDSRLIGAEIVEFDPHRDQDHKTEKLITELVRSITLGKKEGDE